MHFFDGFCAVDLKVMIGLLLKAYVQSRIEVGSMSAHT
jgi:hypothetical protein